MVDADAILKRLMLLLLVMPLLGSSLRAQAVGKPDTLSLDRGWLFRLDPSDRGVGERWYEGRSSRESWREVAVPHTWQVEPGNESYRGAAWYLRRLDAPPGWEGRDLRIEFDAVYRDCTVWLNGIELGNHNGSGWTGFSFPIGSSWRSGAGNVIVVRVDNRFSSYALPYRESFDWAADGGIIRSVRLERLSPNRLDPLRITSRIDPDFGRALVSIRSGVRVESPGSYEVRVRLLDPLGRLAGSAARELDLASAAATDLSLELEVDRPLLWHFDDPLLYRVFCSLERNSVVLDRKETGFGIRRVEVRDGYYYLNGEPMRLMGVEWMPGSDPRYGMAEPPEVSRRILRDMKELNVVLTRFHWQQDDFVFEFTDREGMLVQEEIPAWGPKTMERDLAAVQDSQMREMIGRHFNHPSIYAWGLCNEIGGQSPKAHEFVSRGVELGRQLDPGRLLTWASNSLQKDPEKDASALVDFIEWNDYWESWYGGGLDDLESNLARIAEAYPDKSLVISEYGLCECDPRNPSGDARRIEILKTHTDRYRRAPQVAGAIFFDYNDYRTHIGDKGSGSFQQRVHGVVDLLGRRKPSFAALRQECSPIREIAISPPAASGGRPRATVAVTTRSLENDLPAYTLRRYLLVWHAYNEFGQPMAAGKILLPDLPPGSVHGEEISWEPFEGLSEVRVEIFRPTGYSVLEAAWKTGE